MNYVFFNPDEMRADCLGCYGHPLVKTPNFDRLAAEGTRFEQCHVQHPVCSPSRCSTMTGWYPHVAGHRTLWNLLRPHEPNLIRYLKEAGCHSEWYGKNDTLSPEAIELWMDRVADPGGARNGPNAFEPGEPGFFSFLYEPTDAPVEDIVDVRRLQAGIDFLRSGPPEPFFLFLAFSWPHPPYCVPPQYYDMYSPDDTEPLRPVETDGPPSFHELIRRYRRLDEVPEHVFRKIRAVYLGMVSFVDMMLGRLMDALEETGLADSTTLVAYSDHGDWTGDYGLVEKWPSALDDTMTHVPLIIRTPDGARGHVVPEQVELMDLMPTTMELAGLEVEHTHFARSLLPQLGGAAGDPDRAVFAEGGYDPHEPHCFEGKSVEAIAASKQHIYYPKGLQQQEEPESVCRATMIRTPRHKLVRRPLGVSELYDLEADPRELQNVCEEPAYRKVRDELEGRLLDWYIHTSDVVPRDTHPRDWDEHGRPIR